MWKGKKRLTARLYASDPIVSLKGDILYGRQWSVVTDQFWYFLIVLW